MSPSHHSKFLDDPEFQSLLVACLESMQRGEMIDRVALAKDFPKYASELGQFLDDRKVLEEVAADLEDVQPNPGITSYEATIASNSEAEDPIVSDKIRYIGEYEILEEIARGGMGIVFKARQQSLKRVVALKMILAGRLADLADIERFQREARAAGRLNHPNIVPVHEIGEYEGRHYFTMDFVEGRSLSQEIREETLPPRHAARLVQQCADAVHYAHQQGTVHRDLKPANILLTQEMTPKITDFGLAKLLDAVDEESRAELTASGQILGTPSYMSPEQAAGKQNLVGPSTDIYSLGAILYACLTGRAPFVADSPVDTLLHVMNQEPLSPRVLNPSVPKDLETICLKCLQKEPHKRYGTAEELSEDLQRFLEGRPVMARPIGTISKSWRWTQRNPVIASLMMLSAFLLMGGTAVSSYYAIVAKQRADAEEVERKRADQQTALALKSQSQTEEALAREKVARQISENEKMAARTAEELAKSAQRNEEIERRRAERQSELANQREKQARWHLYVAQLYPMMSKWQQKDFGQLDRLLDASIPAKHEPDFRGWEWYYLRDQTRQTVEFLLEDKTSHIMAYHDATSRLAVLFPDRLELWDPWGKFKKKVIEVEAQPHSPSLVQWSPDGKKICFKGNQSQILILDLETEKAVCEIFVEPRHESFVRCIDWSPDGKRIATGVWYGDLQVWNAETGVLEAELYAPDEKSNLGSVDWHYDSNLLAVGLRYGWTHVYNVNEKKRVWAAKAPNNTGGHAIQWSPDGTYLGAAHGGIVLYSPEGKRLHYFDCHRGSSEGLVWLNETQMVSCGTDQDAVILDATTKTEVERLVHHAAALKDIACNSAGTRIITASGDGQIKTVNLESRSNAFDVLKHNDEQVQNVLFSPDDQLIAAGTDTFGCVWNAKTGEFVDQFEGSKHVWFAGFLHNITWRPDGKMLGATCKAGPPIVWNPETKEVRFPQKQFEFEPYQISWSPDGRYLVLSNAEKCRIREGSTYELLHEFPCGGKHLWINDGQLLRIGTSIIDLEQMKIIAEGQTEIHTVSPDQKVSIEIKNYYQGADEILLTSLVYGSHLLNLRGHNGIITGVTWSPDGRRLGSSSQDGTLKIWDAATGDLLISLPHPEGKAYLSIVWSRDGRRIAAGTSDGEVHLYGSLQMPSLPVPGYIEQGLIAKVRSYEEELAELSHQLREDPDNLEYLRKRISLLEQMQRWQAALEDVNHYQKLSPGDSWRPARGLMLAHILERNSEIHIYTELCQQIITNEKISLGVKAHAALAMILSPEPLKDDPVLMEIARENAKVHTGWPQQILLALCLLRTDRLQELDKVLEPHLLSTSPLHRTSAMIIDVIRHHRLGELEAGRKQYEIVRESWEKFSYGFIKYSTDAMTIHVLMKQAEQLYADKAVAEKSFIANNVSPQSTTIEDRQQQLLIELDSQDANIREKALQELVDLKEKSSFALTKLLEILKKPVSAETAYAIRCIRYIGPEAADAVPRLFEILKGDGKPPSDPKVANWSVFMSSGKPSLETVRFEAASALSHIGPAGEIAVPILIEWLKSPIKSVKSYRKPRTNNNFSPEAEGYAALLYRTDEQGTYTDARDTYQVLVMGCLGNFGSAAQDAIPAILEVQNNPDTLPINAQCAEDLIKLIQTVDEKTQQEMK